MGVTSEGELASTKAPVPVSSESSAESPEELEKDALNVLVKVDHNTCLVVP